MTALWTSSRKRLGAGHPLLIRVSNLTPGVAIVGSFVRCGNTHILVLYPSRFRHGAQWRDSGVSVQSRLAILAQLPANPSADVRYSLLEALRAFGPHEGIPLLKTLSHDEDPGIADKARARLKSFEAGSQPG
jgi:hypothetical protein